MPMSSVDGCLPSAIMRSLALPAFVPLQLAPTDQAKPEKSISIEIPYEQGALTITWPAADPAGCARFVRSLTR